jgi:Permeases of the major facilitator superfamily
MAVFHQQAMVFYNSLLGGFESKGTASGVGVAFGYLGSALSLLFLAEFLKVPEVFYQTALIFLFLSLPAILLLPNPPQKTSISLRKELKDRRFLLLVLAILSLTEVANTLIAMMGIYLKHAYGLEDREIYKVIGLSALGGVFGGLLFGKLTDRLKARRLFPLGFYSLVFVFDCFIFSTKGTATLCRLFGWSFPFSPLDYLKGSTFGAFPLGNCLPSYVLSFSERAHSIHHRALDLEPFYVPDGQRLQTLRPFDGCLSCGWDILLFVLKEIAFPPWWVKTDTTAKGREVIDLKVLGLIGRMHKNKGSSLWNVFVALLPALY